jgi:protein TonB
MSRQASFRVGGTVGTVLLAGGLLLSPAQAAADSPARVDSAFPNPQPPYPPTAQLNGEAGTILVKVLVRPSGKPVRAEVAGSSGFPDLDNAAVEGVLNWRYVPATRDGDTVSDWTTVKVVYQLPAMVPATGLVPSSNP